ncbi:MAG: hypothetical protein AAF213_10695, partial [Pseudomonadota bacterium]
DMKTPSDENKGQETGFNDRRVIAVPETVWRRDLPDIVPEVTETGPCWSAKAEAAFEELMGFLARTWNTPSHIPLEADPLDHPDLVEPGATDGDAQVVDALRCLTIAIGEYVVRLRQLNMEEGLGVVTVGPGDFAEQLGHTNTETPDQVWFGKQVVRLLDWLRGGDVVRHLDPHLQSLGEAMLLDVLDFIYIGAAEITRGNDIDEVFGEDFGADVELVAVNENMPGLVWERGPDPDTPIN